MPYAGVDRVSVDPDYAAFLASKAPRSIASGIEPSPLPAHLFNFQAHCMGIGSEGVVALRQKQKFIGVELKESYWRQASRHLEAASRNVPTLFDEMAA